MLTLVSGKAVVGERRQRIATALSSDILFVVPDPLSASALAAEIAGFSNAMLTTSAVIDFDSLVNELTSPSVSQKARWISAEIALSVIRNILEQDPNDFSYLVGEHSVPRLSHGVLERIASAMEALQKSEQLEEQQPVSSLRGRQLQQLARRFEERLAAAGYRQQKHGVMESITELSGDRWNAAFPTVGRVVFLDFLHHHDLTYLTVNAISRHVENCDVLLDFDPEDEGQAQSSMEQAYLRYYDMADKVIIDPVPMPEGQIDLFEVTEPARENDQPMLPVLVNVDTVTDEITAATAVVKRLLDDSQDKGLSVTIAISNHETYAAALEKELASFGITTTWQEQKAPLRSGEWLLLKRMRDCSTNQLSGAALSALLRAPGFHHMLPGSVTSIEAWDFSSRLDYVLMQTGQLQGWRAILKGTTTVLNRIKKERQRQRLWTEEEGVYDTRLLQILADCQSLLKPFSQAQDVRVWAQQVIALLNLSLNAGTVEQAGVSPLQRECSRMLIRAALSMAHHSALIATQPISFGNFLSLYRTVLYRQSVSNTDTLQSRSVIICDPATAARLRSDCCMVLGFNDGHFPRFARPEAHFMGHRQPLVQSAARARQKAILDKILRGHRRTLLWIPERAGTEELLTSQFAGDLEAAGALRTDFRELLVNMSVTAVGPIGKSKREFVENLKGLVLTEAELKRFRLRSPAAFQVAQSVSVLSQRNQPQMGGYDGLITDPLLRRWLSGWAEQHIYSVSQLDSVVGCSFRFFLDRLLNLEEAEEIDDLLPAHVFGSFVHDVLATFYRRWVADGRQVPTPEDEELARQKLYQAYLDEYEDLTDLSDFARDLLNLKLFGELDADGFGNGYRQFAETKDIGVLGQFLTMEMRRGADTALEFLKPSAFEVGFGMGLLPDDDPLSVPEHMEINLGGGEVVKLRGRIDRIDYSPDGVFAVTDYKTGHVPEKKDIVGGYRTQLPVYVLVGEKLLQSKWPAPEPAGGLYYSLKKSENAKVSGSFFRAAYQQQAGISGRSCLKDDAFEATLADVKQVISRSLKSVRDGYLTTTWRDTEVVCTFCPFDAFCYKNVERTQQFWQSLQSAETDD